MPRKPQAPSSTSNGNSEPDATVRVKRTRIGVWDLYEEVDTDITYLAQWTSSISELYLEFVRALPYLLRMMKDLGHIRSCWIPLFCYLLMRLLFSLLPAAQLWYSGKLLSIVQTALTDRTVDKHLLLKAAVARLMCSVSGRAFGILLKLLEGPLNNRIKQFYSVHYFHALVRLDVPTFDDSAVQRHLEQALPRNSGSSIAWDAVVAISDACFKALSLISEFVIFSRILIDQRDGPLLASISFVHSVMSWSPQRNYITNAKVWAATTKDPDYIKTEGLKRTVTDPVHRKEIVAGGMWRRMLAQFSRSANRITDRSGDFIEVLNARRTRAKLSIRSFFLDGLQELPEVIFTFRAIQHPTSTPISLASLGLVTQTTNNFSRTLLSLVDQSDSVIDTLISVRKLYDIVELPNKVTDGRLPYPDNARSLELGIAIEFRNVSFKYPDSDVYALRNVSFKIGKGTLCVLVGVNGSGKSTILKLICRLHDATEGQIFIDGVDVKALQLDDLRRSISVLFQDYTYFPLSVRDNIALGDPEQLHDDDKILQAAHLGGASEIIRRLPQGLDTYLEQPVRDHYSSAPEGTTTLSGRRVDYTHIRRRAGMDSVATKALSGGQMQRIALSRTFMRTLDSESAAGFLLFDEPSASLDPTSEHDLFQRLRQLRGNKTMIFSSHRFGNLTRHADIILCIEDSIIIEAGTHAQLLEKDGNYARMWRLQAQAFL